MIIIAAVGWVLAAVLLAAVIFLALKRRAPASQAPPRAPSDNLYGDTSEIRKPSAVYESPLSQLS